MAGRLLFGVGFVCSFAEEPNAEGGRDVEVISRGIPIRSPLSDVLEKPARCVQR
jgi:hypothetical protein